MNACASGPLSGGSRAAGFLLLLSVLHAAVPAEPPVERPGEPPKAGPERPPPKPKQILFIQAGKVYPASERPIDDGVVIVTDGKVSSVGGPELVPPEGAKVLRFPGKCLVPGLIDAASSILSQREDFGLLSGSDPTRSSADAVDPFDPAREKAVREGVTAAYLSLGPRSALSGSGAVIRLNGGASEEELIVARAANVEGCLWPEASAFGQRRAEAAQPRYVTFPFFTRLIFRPRGEVASTFDLLGGYRELRSSLLRARAYRRARTWYEQDLGAWEREVARLKKEEAEERAQGRTPQPKPLPARPAEPHRDRFAEALLPVLEGKTRLRIWADTVEEIRLSIRLAREFSVRLALCGGLEAHLVAKEIAEAGAAVVLIPFQVAERLRPEVRLSRGAAQALFKAEVEFGIGTGAAPAEGCHLLRHYVAECIAQGLDPDYALRAVTLTNAGILGIADRLGSIAAGKEGHLAVLDGQPFGTKTRVLLTVVGDKIVYQKEGANEEKKE